MHQEEINRIIRDVRSYIENDYILNRCDKDRINVKLSEFLTELNATYRQRLLRETSK